MKEKQTQQTTKKQQVKDQLSVICTHIYITTLKCSSMQASTPFAPQSNSQDKQQQSSQRQVSAFVEHSLDISSKASTLNQRAATKTTQTFSLNAHAQHIHHATYPCFYYYDIHVWVSSLLAMCLEITYHIRILVLTRIGKIYTFIDMSVMQHNEMNK